jgi:hypothetical protein
MVVASLFWHGLPTVPRGMRCVRNGRPSVGQMTRSGGRTITASRKGKRDPATRRSMTKQELISKQQAMRRSTNRWTAVFLVAFFSIMLANLPLSEYFDRVEPAAWIQVLYGVVFFGFLLGNVPLMIWLSMRQQKRFGLLCPKCLAPLVGVTGQVAVATGVCGNCGERVLSDVPAP